MEVEENHLEQVSENALVSKCFVPAYLAGNTLNARFNFDQYSQMKLMSLHIMFNFY